MGLFRRAGRVVETRVIDPVRARVVNPVVDLLYGQRRITPLPTPINSPTVPSVPSPPPAQPPVISPPQLPKIIDPYKEWEYPSVEKEADYLRAQLGDKISSLAIDNNKISLSMGYNTEDADLEILRTTQHLSSLDLSLAQITGGVRLKHLVGFFLFSLPLGHSKITDEGLRHLAALELTSLNLWGTKITDEGLRHLANLPLSSLHLGHTKISDEGLRHLAHLPLSSLHLGHTKITHEGVRQLREMLPNCRISYP